MAGLDLAWHSRLAVKEADAVTEGRGGLTMGRGGALTAGDARNWRMPEIPTWFIVTGVVVAVPVAAVATPFALVYYAANAAASVADSVADAVAGTAKVVAGTPAEVAGTAKLGSQVREGSADAGYRFGDFTRGVLAKGAAKRSGDTSDGYAFGDLLRGAVTSSSDPAVEAANDIALINAGRKLMVQHRLAIAKLTHPRLASKSCVADADFDVLRQVIAHLGFQMLHNAADDANVLTLIQTNSRLRVYGALVSDDRYTLFGRYQGKIEWHLFLSPQRFRCGRLDSGRPACHDRPRTPGPPYACGSLTRLKAKLSFSLSFSLL
eukprot:COSAG06_NODE_382_length_16566_cov_8.629137_6_plen_321_part_00